MDPWIDPTGAMDSTNKRIDIELTQSSDAAPERRFPFPDFNAFVRNTAVVSPPRPERFPFQHERTPPRLPLLEDTRRDSLFDTGSEEGSEALQTDEFGRQIRKPHPPTAEVVSLISSSPPPEPPPSPEPPVIAPIPTSPSQPWIQSILRNAHRNLEPGEIHLTPHERVLSPVPTAAVPSPPPVTTGTTLRSDAILHGTLILDDPEPAPGRDLTTPPQDEAPDNVLVLFSDGSFLEKAGRSGGCGVALWNGRQWTGKAVALGAIRSSYDAEAKGILEALKLASQMPPLENAVVELCVDHRGLVAKIEYAIESGDWRELHVTGIMRERHNLMGRGIEVRLKWVRGHDVHAGNEMADILARVGANRSSDGYLAALRGHSNRGEVAISYEYMLKMSQEAEYITAWTRRAAWRERLFEGAQRRETRGWKAARRSLKLQYRFREHQAGHPSAYQVEQRDLPYM